MDETNIETVQDQYLTQMPDYLRPVSRSIKTKWSKLHGDIQMGKLLTKRAEKKSENEKTREEAMQMARKIPIELLAKDWLRETQAGAETRAYLVDRIMPTLIMGLEKLLREVERRGLSNEDVPPQREFNPINYIAQYLMRNNPRYSNFSEASPYIRGLRQVNENLKKQLFDMEENRLAKVKAEAKKRRELREKEEMQRIAEARRRQSSLNVQYEDWTSVSEGRLQLSVIQNALRSFAEIADQTSDENSSLRAVAQALIKNLQITDDTGKTLEKEDFVSIVDSLGKELEPEDFEKLLTHLKHCANAHSLQNRKERRRDMLTQLFFSCDHTLIGLIDRHRILNLFEMFWDKAKYDTKSVIRNPRKWPVVEVEEAVAAESECDHEEEFDTIQATGGVSELGTEVKYDEENRKSPNIEEKADEEKLVKEEEVEVEKLEEKTEELEKEETKADKELEKIVNEEDKPTAEGEGETKQSEEESKEPLTKSTTEPETEPAKKAEENVKENEDKEESEIKSEEVAEIDKEEKDDSEKGEKEENDDKEERPLSQNAIEEAEIKALMEREMMKPPMTQQSKVSFAEGTTFVRETTLITSQGTRSQSQASAFDENQLNVSQFVHLTETFVGDEAESIIFNNLIRFVREGYVETEDERMHRLVKARKEALSAKRRLMLNSLFEMWDNDASGFIDLEEVCGTMNKYKNGMEEEAIEKAKNEVKTKNKVHDQRLSKREFRDLLHRVVHYMSGEDTFDLLVEFLISSVERTYTERVRGEARKKWLKQIVTAAETSGASMQPIYRTLFQALYKDAETHGGGKLISAYVAMLERNVTAPSRGPHLLRYVSATSEDAPYVLGKVLYPDMKGISFASIESGKPIHVPKVSNHGNIQFWNNDRPEEEREGSFIVVPLKDSKKRVFGIIGIDTLSDPHSRAIFISHEIQFFQGVAKSFSISYHHVDVREKTLRISQSAISWILRRCPHVKDVTVYMVEPEQKTTEYILRKMIVTDNKGTAHLLSTPPKLQRKDNLFRDYLFNCVDNSESVSADAYGERHLAFPLRDEQGLAVVLLDMVIGDLKALPKLENKEVMKMLKLLQMAYNEISRSSEVNDVEVLFDKLMLADLKENVAKLDAQAYAELKSYKEPPEIIHQIIKAVLTVFYPQSAIESQFNNWNGCKQYLNQQLGNRILHYDPTQDPSDDIPIELIYGYLNAVPHGTVAKNGSIPAQYLYNWVFVCVSLIEHQHKMKEGKSTHVMDVGQTGTTATTE